MKPLDLNKIQVTSPCTTDWQGMTGDDKTRFCDACNKRVYNLSAMTRREVETLVRETSGRFCARVMRNADGSIITATENTGLNLIQLRASKFASAVVSAALSLSPFVATTANANPAQQVQSEKETKRDLQTTNAQGGTAKIYGTIYDPLEAVIVRATITLTNEKTYEKFVTASSDAGTYQFNSVPAGNYELKVESLGFAIQKTTNLELQANLERRIDVTLQVGTTLGEVLFIGYINRAESLDTNTVPGSLLQPIKAVRLFTNKPDKAAKPNQKKKNREQ